MLQKQKNLPRLAMYLTVNLEVFCSGPFLFIITGFDDSYFRFCKPFQNKSKQHLEPLSGVSSPHLDALIVFLFIKIIK